MKAQRTLLSLGEWLTLMRELEVRQRARPHPLLASPPPSPPHCPW